jgi:hypothetical protein
MPGRKSMTCGRAEEEGGRQAARAEDEAGRGGWQAGGRWGCITRAWQRQGMPRGQEQGQWGGCQLCSTGDVRLPLRRSSQLLVPPPAAEAQQPTAGAAASAAAGVAETALHCIACIPPRVPAPPPAAARSPRGPPAADCASACRRAGQPGSMKSLEGTPAVGSSRQQQQRMSKRSRGQPRRAGRGCRAGRGVEIWRLLA